MHRKNTQKDTIDIAKKVVETRMIKDKKMIFAYISQGEYRRWYFQYESNTDKNFELSNLSTDAITMQKAIEKL
ncbi:MAG: hypothetical protein QXH54_05905 [Methanothermobacter sp.]